MGTNELGLTGEVIRQNVSKHLSENIDLHDESISVEIEGGEVIISGDVESDDKKWLAEKVAYDVLGVIHVNNELNVRRISC